MKKAILWLCIWTLIFGVTAFAEISLDGDFTDWQDKPMIEAEQEPQETAPDAEADATIEPAKPQTESNETPTAAPNAETGETALQEQSEEDDTSQPTVAGAISSIAAEEAALTEDALTQPNTLQSQDADTQGNGNGPKFKVHQLRWHIGDNDNILYIMARLSHPPDLETGSFRTFFITDFGEYNAVTSYDTRDGSVLSTLNEVSIADIKGSCNVVNKNTIEIEYGIPLSMLIQDMKWGYLIQFKVITEDDEEPKNSYITISTASTMPYAGVGLCIALGVGIPYLMKRKKKR